MEITRGKIPCAKKTVIYGPEGIGKSTFASKFPDPVFIDTEGSTKDMDVARFDKPSSWEYLLEEIEYVKNDPGVCKTLVIDTIDWAEMLCIEHICNKHQKDGLESFGYGSGYVYVKEEFGKFLNKLSDVVDKGVNVVLTAHAQIRKFEQPDEMGAYDRWELKLGKKTTSQTSPLVKEWADMLLFANYKTYSIAVDEKGKKHKAQGGARVMYTAHHPCWDAKNRYSLPDEVPFEYGSIAHIFSGSANTYEPNAPTTHVSTQQPVRETKPVSTAPEAQPAKETPSQISDHDVPAAMNEPEQLSMDLNEPASSTSEGFPVDPRVPKHLRDLMIANHVCEWDIENVVEARGYVPTGTKIWEYDTVNPGIIDGLLVASWDQVYDAIKEMKEKQEIPFN